MSFILIRWGADKGCVALRLRRRGMARFILWALAGLCLLTARAPGGSVAPARLAEDQIKAGFLFNFTRFVGWSESPFVSATAPFALCIVDDPVIAELLTQASAGRVVNGRGIEVRRMRPGENLRGCNVVFLGGTSERQAGRMIDGLKGASVLTVGESPEFLQAGGMLNFRTEEDQVKLELNLEAARRGGVLISAKLIGVSRLVAGGRD